MPSTEDKEHEKDTFRLLFTSNSLIVEQPIATSTPLFLSIDASGKCIMQEKSPDPAFQILKVYRNTSYFFLSQSVDIFGVVGVLKLCSSTYLLVLTNRQSAGFIQSHKVFRVQQVEAIKISPETRFPEIKISPAADALDAELLESTLAIMNSGKLLYSTTYDLTHSLQHRHLSLSTEKGETVIDDRYWFNKAMTFEIIEASGNRENPWILKMIAGDAGTIDLPEINGSSFKTTIIARLSTLRLGTRYSLFYNS